MSNSIDYSAYRGLGQGEINRFSSETVLYDIGCVDLDDPVRRLSKAELVAALKKMTAEYLKDSFEFVALPATRLSYESSSQAHISTTPAAVRFFAYCGRANDNDRRLAFGLYWQKTSDKNFADDACFSVTLFVI